MYSFIVGCALLRTATGVFLPKVGAAIATIIGFGLSIGTFIAAMAIGTGFKAAFLVHTEEGTPPRFVIQREGARSESGSSLVGQEIFAGTQNPDIDLRSEEFLVLAYHLPLLREKTTSPLQIRGITMAALDFRPAFRIVNGRLFRPGHAEAIVGTAAARTYSGMGIGETISHHDFEPATWKIVGHFSTGGDVHESEAWVDLATSQSIYRGGSNMLSVIWVTLKDGSSLDDVEGALSSDPRYPVTIAPEALILENRSGVALSRLYVFATVVGVISILSAILIALGATQTVVAHCLRGIRTLHTIGFSKGSLVWCAVLIVLVLSAIGGGAGVAIAFATFDGLQTSATDGWALQTSFDFSVSLASIAYGLLALWGVVIVAGLIAASFALRRGSFP